MFFPGGDIELIIKASRLMVDAHEGQFRDGGTVPFRVHPFRVASLAHHHVHGMMGRDLLHPYTGGEVVAAALVHDVPEDVPADRMDHWVGRIREELGEPVAKLALLLRNPSKDLPTHTARAAKKEADRRFYRRPETPAAVRIVKLCDRIDNLNDMGSWKPEKVRLYADESDLLLDAILLGLWESKECAAYGITATKNAFAAMIGGYRHAVEAARLRVRGAGGD